MLTLEFLEDIANKLSQVLPESLQQTQEDLKQNFKLILQTSFAKMNLVTREEFETQTALLKQAQQKLRILEERIETHLV